MSYNRLAFGSNGITELLDESGRLMSQYWQRWFSTGVVPAINNTTPLQIPGPFANDAAAKAGGVPIGSAYYKSTGAMVVRLA